MQTIIGKDLDEAKRLLETNELIGLPTETVYGLAGNALNPNVVLKIFQAKDRPQFDPLIVHTHSIEEISKYVVEIPDKAIQLLETFSPGPLTILLKKKSIIPDLVTSGLDTVAIRIPNHPLTLDLLRQLTFPLAAPSANPFGYISPTSAQHVSHQLGGKIPYILNGGSSAVGVESTIVGFEEDEVIIYRIGGLAIETIETAVGKVRVQANESSNPRAPGMLKSHYAPKTPLFVLQSEEQITDIATEQNIAIIGFDKYLKDVPTENQFLLSSDADLAEAAKNLFAQMRTLDEKNYKKILVVKFPDIGLGRAINDRLKRAASQ